ncbi:1247_t:CDS:2 [Paraglomus brasilianum]|uniref:1247_t:CDS:1 n=1 Tax=Paraglomus brasilianum TaxID=144538 RepID=A0A9N8YYA7_9GLOM|nr:1247_t:CDS:2 [Paraglomus brasilianum]
MSSKYDNDINHYHSHAKYWYLCLLTAYKHYCQHSLILPSIAQDVSSALEIYDDDNERRSTDACTSSTHMVPHNAKLQKHLRQEILTIQNDRDLSAGEKAKKVQELMMSNWKALSKKSTRVVSNRLTEDDVASTYNPDKKVLGCAHYQRAAKLQASCCGGWFTCRFCHDEACDHQINR